MDKLLTISIAAYNVENFLRNTLDSLLVPNKEYLEVLIVNDGSKDKTSEIAKEYEEKYPGVFKLISKENGGYGSTINSGIEHATGKYFKQLDGDDWYDTKNLEELIECLKDTDVDVVYTPYIEYYEGKKQNNTKLISNKIENNDSESLEECLKDASYLLMYNLTYKTQILKEHNIKIDEHCFYTDTEYVVYPLIYSKTIKILKMPIYMYRIGVEGQSISVAGKLKHYGDHVKMSNSLLEKSPDVKNLSPTVREFIENYMAHVFSGGVGNYLMLLKPNKEHYDLILSYIDNIKNKNIEVYNMLPSHSDCVKMLYKKKYMLYKLYYYLKIVKRKIIDK